MWRTQCFWKFGNFFLNLIYLPKIVIVINYGVKVGITLKIIFVAFYMWQFSPKSWILSTYITLSNSCFSLKYFFAKIILQTGKFCHVYAQCAYLPVPTYFLFMSKIALENFKNIIFACWIYLIIKVLNGNMQSWKRLICKFFATNFNFNKNCPTEKNIFLLLIFAIIILKF